MSALREGKRGSGERTLALRKRIKTLLEAGDFKERLSEWGELRPRQAINPLISFLCSGDELIKWRAVTATGIVMAAMADEEMEPARVVMRRLIWSLNDESGGIGWGAPEAMGEIMAMHEGLAREYAHILLSYISEDGNHLENRLLERGVIWGLGRLARIRPTVIEGAARHILSYVQSEDVVQRGFALWALSYLDIGPQRDALAVLRTDDARVALYEEGELRSYSIGELARRAMGASG